VDFDGVICPYNKDYCGPSVFNPPIYGASEGMRALAENGYELIINTCRGEVQDISDYLNSWDIPFHGINSHENPDTAPKNFIRNDNKIFCDIYLDDRGLQFQGDWGAAVQSIESFVIWYKRLGSKYEGIEDKVGFGTEYESKLDHATSYLLYQTVPYINSLIDKSNEIENTKLRWLKQTIQSLAGLMECD